MVKELRTVQDDVQCEVCGRTILKGERPETFLAPGGARHLVCELCWSRAEHEGWIRESAQNHAPATRARPQQRRSLVGRLRGMFDPDTHQARPPEEEAPPVFEDEAPPVPREREPAVSSRTRREARQIRAVPTTAEVKVDRAIELFNASEHPRTIGGIARTLGAPWVHASPDANAASEVTIVVAWELSWYRYRIDLGDADEPILLLEKGDELGELEEPLREWNALADENGRLAAM